MSFLKLVLVAAIIVTIEAHKSACSIDHCIECTPGNLFKKASCSECHPGYDFDEHTHLVFFTVYKCIKAPETKEAFVFRRRLL